MNRINNNSSTRVDYYVSHLEDIKRYFSIYICFFYLIFGNIGIVFKIVFFLQKPVRACPCVIYVLAASIVDFVTLNNIPILKLLSSLYPSKRWIYITINRSILSEERNEQQLVSFSSRKANQICKIRNYIHMWSTDVSIQLLVFASINRYLLSSKKLKPQVNQRLMNVFCNYSSAIKISFCTYIIGALISLHHYFNFTVVSNFCIPKHFLLWAIWIFDIHCFIPSTLMIIFSILTLINVRKSPSLPIRRYGNTYGRISTTSNQRLSIGSNRHHIEQQLTSMIIAETIVTIMTTVPYAIYVLYQAMKTENVKNLEELARDDLIEGFVRATMYLEPSCGFYIYLFTLTTLRKRFSRILLNKIRFF